MKLEISVEELVSLQRTKEVEELENKVAELQRSIEDWRECSKAAQGEEEHWRNQCSKLRTELHAAKLPAPAFMGNKEYAELAKAFAHMAPTDHNNRNKIQAIKAVRTALRCGLKEAKDIVEGTECAFVDKPY